MVGTRGRQSDEFLPNLLKEKKYKKLQLPHQTIKEVVFQYVHRTNGIINYHELTEEVLKHDPESKWKYTHWAWYRYHILKGKFKNQFSEEERQNLESYSQTSGSSRSPISRPRDDLRIKKYERKPQSVVKSSIVFVNKLKEEQRVIALSLARVCHYVHPDIVERVRLANEEYREQLAEIIPNEIDIEDYLYTGSACVFPGVRRYIGRLKKEELLRYVPEKSAIIDDNRFPRYLWTYLVSGKGYSGPIWKATGLNEFELAHIFSHKPDERKLEERVFEHVAPSPKPYGLFTCASNIVLIPKGMAKPTDDLDAILIAFFKRFIDLYGIETLPGFRELKEKKIPEWYDDLEWNEPILPPNWEANVIKLLKYRNTRLEHIFSSPVYE